jgi:hypothetical protein
MSLAAGDANATIGADIMDYRWECIESLQSDIPSDSTDIKRIADWIAASYTGEPNATEEVKPHA